MKLLGLVSFLFGVFLFLFVKFDKQKQKTVFGKAVYVLQTIFHNVMVEHILLA